MHVNFLLGLFGWVLGVTFLLAPPPPPPRGRSIDDLSSLVSIIDTLCLSTTSVDKWYWSLDPSGSFKVNTLTKLIQDKQLDRSLDTKVCWNSWVPRKVNVCVWRTSLDRLPSRVNLIARGVNIPSSLCLFYETEAESLDHCLIRCPRIILLWRKVWRLWRFDTTMSIPDLSIFDIASGNVGNLGNEILNRVLHGVYLSVLWSIWK